MKSYITLLLALVAVTAAQAQDLIVKVDSTRIEALVQEISPESVRYKRYARPEGPTYVLPVAQISYIRYADGYLEEYNRPKHKAPILVGEKPELKPTTAEQPAAAPAPTPAATPAPKPTPAPQPAPQPQVTTPTPAPAPQPTMQLSAIRFEVGQYYNYNGLEGVVVAINEDGTHGLLISMQEVMIDWSTFRKDDLRTVGADDAHSGKKNMEAVERYIAEHNLSWDHFPAFKWCRELGEGWYLPSIDELLSIGNNYNGGNRLHNNRQARLRFNENLKEHGGERIDGKCYYYSSTEQDEKIALAAHMGLEPPFVFNEIAKYTKFLVRAVHAF